MKLSLALLEDIEKNKDDRLNIEKAIKGLNRPLFIAHGDQDISVPFREAKDLYGWANKDITSFLEIPATGILSMQSIHLPEVILNSICY